MCTSIRPGRRRAGSSFSWWLVVKMMILSSPQLDHRPSMKFSTPDKVETTEHINDLFILFNGDMDRLLLLRERNTKSVGGWACNGADVNLSSAEEDILIEFLILIDDYCRCA